MSPEELIFAIMLLVVLPLSMTKMILNYKRSKDGTPKKETSKPVSSENALTTSELQRLIRDAVNEATLSLSDRIEDLEDDLKALTSKNPELSIDDPIETEVPLKTLGRRTRS
jgi:hypothetical protein